MSPQKIGFQKLMLVVALFIITMVAQPFAIAAMALLIAAGIRYQVEGAWDAIWHHNFVETTRAAIHGLELILLAPLATAILKAVSLFLDDDEDGASAMNEVKLLLMSLLCGLQATNLVGLALDKQLEGPAVWANLALLALLCGYVTVLLILSRRTTGTAPVVDAHQTGNRNGA